MNEDIIKQEDKVMNDPANPAFLLQLIGFDDNQVKTIEAFARRRELSVLALIRQSIRYYQASTEPVDLGPKVQGL